MRQTFESLRPSRLAYFKVPRWIRFLDEIPKGPTGKLQRIGLAKRLGVEAILEERPDYLAPVTLHERAVAEIWSEVLKQDRNWPKRQFPGFGRRLNPGDSRGRPHPGQLQRGNFIA